MRGLSLSARITATLGVVMVVVSLVITGAAVTFMTVRQDQQRVIDTYYEAVTSSNEQFIRLLDAETAIRGYALTGDPAQLAPMAATRAGDQGWPERVDRRLRSLLADDPKALALLTATETSATAWWQQWAQPTVDQVRSGGPGSVSAADIELGTRLFEGIRGDYSAYVDRLDDRRHDAADALRQSTARLFAAVIAIAVVALLALVAVAWLLRRWVTGPLTRLADETHIVRDSDLSHAVHVDGPPELARLADDVEAMRRGLVDRIEAARASASELRAAHVSLEEQTAELERSNRDLEQFAYAASHDLQEPLRKVASFTQMLQRRYSGQLDERADQYIEFAVDGAKRMQQLITDLLQFSRVGRVTSAQVEVDLDACLDRALRDLDTAIETSGAVITRDELPVVRGEAVLLTQVLVNLVGNAIKFRSQQTPRVHVGARRQDDAWSLWVSDNGIGIEPRYADRVFVIFQRLHPKEMYGGTGIGLALCQKIIEYHGGSMWVDVDGPADQVGTTIRWSLPALDGAVREDGHAVDPAFDLGGTDAE